MAAWFDCRRHDVVDAGDHIILVGRVVGFDERAVNPLGYCKGAHVTFGLQFDALSASGGRTRVGAILERERAIVLVDDGQGGLDIPKGAALGDSRPIRSSLVGNLRRLGLDAELGFLFAVYEDPAQGASTISIVYRGQLRSAPARRSTRGACTDSTRFPGIAFATPRSPPCCGATSRSGGRTSSASTSAMPSAAQSRASHARPEGSSS